LLHFEWCTGLDQGDKRLERLLPQVRIFDRERAGQQLGLDLLSDRAEQTLLVSEAMLDGSGRHAHIRRDLLEAGQLKALSAKACPAALTTAAMVASVLLSRQDCMRVDGLID
jgi:hypothetical protein